METSSFVNAKTGFFIDFKVVAHVSRRPRASKDLRSTQTASNQNYISADTSKSFLRHFIARSIHSWVMWAEIDNGKRHRVNQNIVCFGVAFWRNEFIGKTLHVSRWAEVIVFASQFRAIRQFHNLASFVKVKAAFTSVANRQLNTRGHKRARMDVVDKEQQKNTFVSVRRPSSPL